LLVILFMRKFNWTNNIPILTELMSEGLRLHIKWMECIGQRVPFTVRKIFTTY
jgi:hypothetical protein